MLLLLFFSTPAFCPSNIWPRTFGHNASVPKCRAKFFPFGTNEFCRPPQLFYGKTSPSFRIAALNYDVSFWTLVETTWVLRQSCGSSFVSSRSAQRRPSPPYRLLLLFPVNHAHADSLCTHEPWRRETRGEEPRVIGDYSVGEKIGAKEEDGGGDERMRASQEK